MSAMKQLKLKALAIMLVKVVKGNSSALSLCHYFLTTVDNTQHCLSEKGLPLEMWTKNLVKELSMLDDNKPGVVARVLFPITMSILPSSPPPCPMFNVSFVLKFDTLILFVFIMF